MEVNDNADVKALLKKIKVLSQKSQLPDLMIEFYVRALFLQDAWHPESLDQENGGETAKKKVVDPKELPLIRLNELPLDIKQCRNNLLLLIQLAEGINPLLTMQAKKINMLLEENRISLEQFQYAASGRFEEMEHFAEKEEMEAGVFFFLLRSAVRASVKYELNRARFQKDYSAWRGDNCPVCGSLPHFSYLSRHNGKRMLSCSFCGQQWNLDRISCPFCGNLDTESLRIATIDQEPGMRVDICEKCRKYLKVMDLREMESTDCAALDDLGTLPVDLRMHEEGLTRPIPVPV